MPGDACPDDVIASATTICRPGSGDICDPEAACTSVPGAAWPDDDRRSRIVFITRDLDRSVIEEKLDSLTAQAAALNK